MQVGVKTNEVGWQAYQECMKAGAIIATGHEHSYARTLTLTNLGNPALGHGWTGRHDAMRLARGSTFVFVSGLGGVGMRTYSAAQHDDDTWWSAVYSSDRWVRNGALQRGVGNYGALFIRFNVGGNPRRADGYFKDIDGRVADAFTVLAE
jgi:hypothetical protein